MLDIMAGTAIITHGLNHYMAGAIHGLTQIDILSMFHWLLSWNPQHKQTTRVDKTRQNT
jgi:hypothetical protein